MRGIKIAVVVSAFALVVSVVGQNCLCDVNAATACTPNCAYSGTAKISLIFSGFAFADGTYTLNYDTNINCVSTWSTNIYVGGVLWVLAVHSPGASGYSCWTTEAGLGGWFGGKVLLCPGTPDSDCSNGCRILPRQYQNMGNPLQGQTGKAIIWWSPP